MVIYQVTYGIDFSGQTCDYVQLFPFVSKQFIIGYHVFVGTIPAKDIPLSLFPY